MNGILCKILAFNNLDMKHHSIILLYLIFAFTSIEALAVGKYKKVVATNTWTAAYAIAAGFDQVDILAPASTIHPSEYELTPGDIKKLFSADLILFAGYEVMGKFIENDMKDLKSERFKLVTDYDYATIERQVKELALMNGSMAEALTNLNSIKNSYAEASSSIQKLRMDGETILVHSFQRQFASAMNLPVVATFGPEPLEAFQIRQLVKYKPTFIIDNFHNSVSAPLTEIDPNIKVVKLLNFPGQFGTETIQDVIIYNAKTIFDSLNP